MPNTTTKTAKKRPTAARKPLSPIKQIAGCIFPPVNKCSPQNSPIRKQFIGIENGRPSPTKHPSASPRSKVSIAMRALNLQKEPPSTPNTPSFYRKTPENLPKTPVQPKQIRTPQRTPRQTPTKKAVLSTDVRQVYREVKSVLSTQRSDEIVGRDDEIDKLLTIINHAKNNNTGRAVYISGAPGTGKTASVLSLQLPNLHHVNCMESASTPLTLYLTIAKLLQPTAKTYPKTIRGLQAKITKILTTDQYILLLDEIDRLASTTDSVGNLDTTSTKKTTSKSTTTTPEQAALCWLFSLASKTKLVLLAIANTLDFTERAIPELYYLLPPENRPVLINYQPYTKDQLIDIVKFRLSSKTISKVAQGIIPQSVLMFTCMKISNQYGDVRRVLDVLKRAVENVEFQALKTQKVEGVSMQNVTQMLNSAQNDISKYFKNDNTDDDSCLPLQQALFLCATFKSLQSFSQKQIEFFHIKQAYIKVCNDQSISSCDDSELMTILNNLEDLSFLQVKKVPKNQTSKWKITLSIEKKDIQNAFQDKLLLSKLFS